MHVQVEVLCAPHPVAEIEEAMRSAGKRLALVPDSVQVEVRVGEGGQLVAILEFEMRRAAHHQVVDEIWEEVKFWTWQFREDIAVRFPKG
jgi:hypothetical protein